ncbi:MAG: DUF1572 domain-containing protein [Bacteroidetes bacterium]|nr:DUF1572 domain-containing protein [Bacteroidota bacterium]MBU1373837.1 DUF1572 domain-containing protein [Bacteroidota bacterium]MBU1483943.1 DUF1572 domain-containing protein [Bacteroidota bacterium]MBU1761804.1 DUF1572 domain-containing protein [Bacteroidota bacterium]MBU2268470.1 DUF1572 domain-containing protein [Bacteroidota bacterium]
MIETLQGLFKRDLNRLKNEIELYKSESDIWKIKDGISNSGGNLCLHLIGNLNAYIGKELGGTNYERNRPLEFSAKDVPRKDLIIEVENTLAIVINTLENLDEMNLKNEYPILVFENPTSTEYMLIHLTTHLTYHLGQINYHRRLIESVE